jgi:hypothetical protein
MCPADMMDGSRGSSIRVRSCGALIAVAACAGGVAACSAQSDGPTVNGTSSGGATGVSGGSGGTVANGMGGMVAAGGFPAGTGGGVPSSGGTNGSGGSAGGGTGGVAPGAGGAVLTGGAGGTVATGGAANAGSGGMGGAPSMGPVTFSKNVRLNDDTGSARQTEVALAAGPNGLALAGWMDERAERVCAYSFSTDGGLTWSKNVSIPNTASFVGDPAVAIDGGGTLYAVCQQYLNSTGSAGGMRMMSSRDRGQTWSAIQTINSNPDKPWAAGGAEDGTLFVSWLGNPGGIKRSTDHGATWGPVQSTGNIVHGTGITPSAAGLLHVPYNLDSSRNQLRYLRSKDNGVTYDAPRDLIADMGTFCFTCNPRQHPIVGSASDPTGKFVAITWASRMTAGEGDDDVWLLYSKDGGDTWTQPIRVNDNTTKSRQFESWVAVDTFGRVHVAWTDYRDGGQNETFYARSADPTKGFEKNLQVTDGRGSGATDFLGDYKGIAVQGSDVLIVWQDTRRDSGDIYFSRAAGAAGP